jgi:hypothetical protein
MSYNNLVQQFNEMLDRGIIPCMEYQLPDNEWLVVDMQVMDLQSERKGVVFSLSEDLKPYFSGNVEKIGRDYLIPYDADFDCIDDYIAEINIEVIEGLLIPNNLLVDGD